MSFQPQYLGRRHKEKLDEYILDIINCIEEATKSHIPFNRPKPENRNKTSTRKIIPGWVELVRPHQEEANFWYQIWLSSGKPDHGDIFWNMRTSRSNFKRAKKKCINAEEVIKRDKFTEACLNGDKSLFEELKKMKGKSNTHSTKIDDKNSPEEIADHFGEIYKELFNKTGSADPMKNLLKEVNGEITEDQLADVMKVNSELIQKILKERIKPGKTDPEFEMTTDAMKNGPAELSDHLATFIRSCLTHGYISLVLLTCAIQPLVKDTNGKLDSSANYRGIGIGSLIMKVIDWIVLILFDNELTSDPNQFGFQAKSSTTMCSWTVVELVNQFKNSGSTVVACLLDYRKAFDLVNHEKLFKILMKRGVGLIFVRLLMFIYINQKCYIKWNGVRSYSFDVTNGTRQGSIFSPRGGFGVYLDPLLQLLRESGHGLRLGLHWYGALAYADDVILLATSVSSLQELVNICQNHAAENDLVFSTHPDPSQSKTVCMAFHCQDKEKLAKIHLNNDPLPWKSTAKHIGCTLHEDGTMDQDLCGK